MNQREKTGGRTKGTPNKSTKEVRGKIEQIINSFDTEGLIKDLKSLESLERLKVLISLCEYVAPKYQRISHEVELTNESRHVENLTDEEREKEIRMLVAKANLSD